MECNCEILNVTQGTDISLKVTLTRGGEAFPVELSEQVAVAMVSERGERVAVDFTVGDEGRLLVTLRSDDFRTGRYGLEVVGVLNGAKWRAFGQSVVRYTFETVKGAERVAVQGDEYDVTLDVGLVSDIVPTRTSELLNDGEDGEHPFATEQAVTALDRKFGNYIPTSQKGAKGGVAELNGDGKIPTAQAQFALRGNLVAADIDSTALQTGFYRVIGQRLGADILGGDEANGVLIQYSDGYKEQVLHVGRTAGAAAGEQVETYTRRYLPTPKRWTEWYKADGGGGSDEIYFSEITEQAGVYTYDPTAAYQAFSDGKVVIGVYNGMYYYGTIGQDGHIVFFNITSPGPKIEYFNGLADMLSHEYIDRMSMNEAQEGTSANANFISPYVLKKAILYHTSDLVNGGAYNSTTKKIELKHGSKVVAEIDAAPFIVDGMVEDVRIENGNLVIDFNTESGKQDIAIPLTDIFDPANYYTKTQTDSLLSGKASTADVTALQQQVAGKQDAIQDLAEIRSGAAAGATAVQPAALQPYATQAWVGQQGFLTEHQDISGKEDKMRIVGVPTGATGLAAAAGCYYAFADDLGTFDITLPLLTDVTTVQTVVFYMTMGSAPAVTFYAGSTVFYHDGFELASGKTYEVNALWNGAAWVVASVEIVVN